jgi:mono/diheme cytochrome c family protein
MSRKFVGVLAVLGLWIGMSVAQGGDISAGNIVYDKKCRICHGDHGEGNPDVAKKLKAVQKPLGSDEIQKKTDAEFKQVITEGKGKMKPPKNVSDADMINVIAFVRTLKGK